MFWPVLKSKVAGIRCLLDRRDDLWVVDFAGCHFVAAGISGGVEVSDLVNVLCDVDDQITFADPVSYTHLTLPTNREV